MYLQRLNPSIKACTVVLLIILLAFIFDPVTPMLMIFFTMFITLAFGKVRWKTYFLFFIPFSIFAFGMLWTTLVFQKPPTNATDTITILWWSYPRESLLIALALSTRVLAVGSLSLLFIFTTNTIDFILSLIQQCKVPPKIAYGVLAGYRFLPMMRDEMKLVHAAHRIRGINEAHSIWGKWKQYSRFAIPLLASAIRKAERTAMAMESKGFTGDRQRTYYKSFSVVLQDIGFLLLMVAAFAIAAYLSFLLGYFKWGAS